MVKQKSSFISLPQPPKRLQAVVKKEICFQLGGDRLKSDREEIILGFCFLHQNCQGFSKYCNKKATAGGKDFFSRAECCAESLQCDPETPQHHQVKETAD